MAGPIECPKCGKQSVVQRKDDLYQCLSCEFKRDLSKPLKPKSNNNGIFWITVVAAIIALFALEARDASNSPNTPSFQMQSFTAPGAVQSTNN